MDHYIVDTSHCRLNESSLKPTGFYDDELRAQLIARGHVLADFFDDTCRKPDVLDDLPNIGPAPVRANLLGNDSYKAGEAPPRRIFRPPSPMAPNHRRVSST